MHNLPQFAVETVDGDRLGKLSIPILQIADWLNFLIAPPYTTDIISAEQTDEVVELYFQANEGLYMYLEMRLNHKSLAA